MSFIKEKIVRLISLEPSSDFLLVLFLLPYVIVLKLPQAPNTCTFFYYFGLQGHIPKELCDTLQFFAFEPCGCADDPAGAPPADDSGNSGNERRERKPVDPEYEAKEANKMSNGYGGAGGQYHSGRRGLKGAPLLPYKKQGSAK